jgi:hypothetical protein
MLLALAVLLAIIFFPSGCGDTKNCLVCGTDPAGGPLALIDIIQVPGTIFTSFDISWVDPDTERYFLADRSNASVDIFNAANDTFVTRIAGFVGPSTSNDTAGPNGVVSVSANQVWAGDGDSTVKVMDLTSNKIIATISTGGTARADEMAFDPKDNLILVANDADDIPFVSFVSTTNPTNSTTPLAKIFFDGTNPLTHPLATNGLEQPVWNPATSRFLLSVPEIGGNAANGAIAEIDPVAMKITRLFPVSQCQPAGLALGPSQNLLVGCANHDAVRFPAKLIILDAGTGKIIANITQVGGSDEVWFNPGDNRYYVAARDNPTGPVLGVIDAKTNIFLQNITTATNSHSVAADPKNNHVFVPLRGGSSACAQFTVQGCIGVFAAPSP